jgi:hypothetical protein
VSSATDTTRPSIDGLSPLQAGGGTMRLAAIAGVLGLLVTAFGFATAPKETAVSYLVAFAYWIGIALGGLFLVMIFNTAGARWTIVLRRAMETMASATPLFVLLFLPIWVFKKELFSWIDLSRLGAEEAAKVAEKSGWLNAGSFGLRAVVYFAVFIGLQQILYGWSLKQDSEASAALTRRQRALSSGGLPFLALAFTVGSLDWLMSLSPTFSSTIFGVYYFAGSFLAAIAVLVIATAQAREVAGSHGPLVSLHHWHNLGKLLLAFTAFWAYIAMSQLLLIWIANLPEEIPWYIVRMQGGWKPVFVALGVGQFVLPFFLLLSRDLKLQPGKLKLVAGWILFAHFIDLCWLVLPVFHEQGPSLHWSLLTAFVGVGGVAIAFALFRARGKYAVPVGDPYLDDSLRYTQP